MRVITVIILLSACAPLPEHYPDAGTPSTMSGSCPYWTICEQNYDNCIMPCQPQYGPDCQIDCQNQESNCKEERCQ